MTFKEKLINLIHKIYREDDFINSFFNAEAKQIEKADNTINKLSTILHFNRLDADGCKWWEKLLKITDIASTISDRQARIRAKWISDGHNTAELIQNVCDSWKNGEVDVDFVDGKIKLTFDGDYGIPADMDGLINSINIVKPTFIALWIVYKYLLIRDIHEVKTIEQMETLTLNMFAMGTEG